MKKPVRYLRHTSLLRLWNPVRLYFRFLSSSISRIKPSPTPHLHRGPKAAETQFGDVLLVFSISGLLWSLTFFRVALSMDSSRGKDLFKFDRSLMERLADNGFPMSQINVQRRMRPAISHHIRYELILGRKTPSPIFLSQNDLIPEAGGQRYREDLSRCERNERKCCVFHALQQGRRRPGVGIQSQLVRGTYLLFGIRNHSKLASPGENDRRHGHVLPAPGRIQRSR